MNPRVAQVMQRQIQRLRWLLLWWVLQMGILHAADPIQVDPENPRYFRWRGKPIAIVTSGEHYGAVVNLDFDFRRYLDTLAKDGLNGTRVWAGAYVETGGSFGINGNTLDPAPGRFICPWARSDVPGYADGGNKFDLMRWDPAYFERLKQFVRHASRRGVVVEVNLFCPMYEDSMWTVCPMNVRNNINGLGDIPRHHPLTLDKSGGLLGVQEALVRKLAAELREFDNVTFEIVNEPYATQPRVPDDWQRHMTDVLVDAMKPWPKPFLISWNIANFSESVANPHPAVSLFNFHYATPPDAVRVNWGLGKPIGDNETGFRGTNDAPYRMEAWDFLMAGGALFNHLDYSFAVGHEEGSFVYPATQPGGGNAGLRRQFGVLSRFVRHYNLAKTQPETGFLLEGTPAGGSARVLAEPGRHYGVYFRKLASTGAYSVRWTGQAESPLTGDLRFHTSSNDGVRLWIDDRLIIDRWVDQTETEHTGVVRVEKGQQLRLKLEYFYNGGQGAAKMAWSGPGYPKKPVPPEALTQPGTGSKGLLGEYFFGNQFQSAWTQRVDAQVQFAWGTEGPFPKPVEGGPTHAKVRLPEGRWNVEWMEPVSGRILGKLRVTGGGERSLVMPEYREDLVMRVWRR